MVSDDDIQINFILDFGVVFGFLNGFSTAVPSSIPLNQRRAESNIVAVTAPLRQHWSQRDGWSQIEKNQFNPLCALFF